MHNFVFHNPTKIIFGRNTIPAIGTETTAFGRRILLVSGTGSAEKNGILRQVRESMAAAGAQVFEHPGVRSNPVLSHVRAGIALAKKHDCEAVCAVGGGSVIDEAKAICAGAVVNHDVWKFFIGKKSITTPLPLTTILTLAASGSEMNSGMVITNEETRQKFGFGNKKLHPQVSILDPTTTCTVPLDYTAYGAVDAIAHVLEFYFTTKEPFTPVQDRLMEGLVINSMECCNRIMLAPEDYQARADLMWAATLALNGLTAAGLGKVGFPMHMIEHSLSAFYDVAHGAGLSVVIPAWMRWQLDLQPERLAQFAMRVFDCHDGNTAQRANEGIDRLEQWFTSVNSPTRLKQLNIPEKDFPEIACNALTLGKIWRIDGYDQDKIEAILRLANTAN
ncbi:MAG: iron-containing alcohol dehydrogenase [Desulfobulbaceae bacterium]|uniref:Iron-containing alcohol dehydrogenase n=1 Tax=Candidatus Desulfatifera sulfidica TaxID=2841691 RepID=A0A8J6N9K5_9BACT|nr:iron-containing alcohol dehydrogenase [Candidatus Desulfatifera sulfidica]